MSSSDIEHDSAVSVAPDATSTVGEDFKYFLEARNHVTAREAPDSPTECFSIVRQRIEPPAKKPLERILLIGFDTEYEALKPLYRHDDVMNREARYAVLSYQLFAKIDGLEFREIIVPNAGDRFSFVGFITYALAKITSAGVSIPRTIVLVGHYNKADFPAFDDRDQAFKKLAVIRNSLVTLAYPIKVRISFSDDAEDFEEVNVHVRDSILMAPSGQRSLEAVGKLIGKEKIKLHDDPAIEREIKRNIKIVRDNSWPLFREYALLDAEISALYYERVAQINEAVTGTKSIPTALSNIGVRLLLKEWAERVPELDRLELIGKEQVKEEVWNDWTGGFITYKEEPFIEEVSWYIDFITECYHGGRSEQMWFGPSEIADFSDYDLAAAYPTAMAILKKPNWSTIRPTRNIDELRLGNFAFACVDFQFPDTVRYPTLPVRTSRGILFPLRGRSYCCAPEIELALNLGARLTVRHGVVVDTSENPIFLPFIKGSLRLRDQAGNDLERAFWKEVSNSSYGKTAQGLREKRVFNLKSKKTKPIPPSPITNPFFAAFITSSVRAVIGEIINALPASRSIFSVTTDGFLTNAGDEEVRWAATGRIAKQFSDARWRLTGTFDLLSKKHSVKRLLGWRTRGQATLVPDAAAGEKGIALAKAGIKTPTYATKVAEQNDYIIKEFLSRVPGRKFVVDTHTTMREIMLFNADLVTKSSERAISMEYDFKRRPVRAWEDDVEHQGKNYRHLAFDTAPWQSVNDFKLARQLWEDHSHVKTKIVVKKKDKAGRTKAVTKSIRKQRYCLTTAKDFRRFAVFHDMKIAVKGKSGTYLRSDLSRLRRDLCAAYQHGAAGLQGCRLRFSAKQFADLLNQCGFADQPEKVTRTHVEYGLRCEFERHSTPPTPKVTRVLRLLSERIPSLKPTEILASFEGLPLLLPALDPQ